MARKSQADASLAAIQLTSEVLEADWSDLAPVRGMPARVAARRQPLAVRLIIQEVVKALPAKIDDNTVAYVRPIASANAKKVLQAAIVIGFFFTVFWEVIISVIAGLVVRWILRDDPQKQMIERMRP